MTRAFAADADARAHVFVTELADRITVAGADGHHLERVRRLRPGEPVTAADGAGTWRSYEVASAAQGGLELRAVGGVVEEPVPSIRITLAFAPTKGGQPERVVQHATELGVDRLHPLVTERTIVRWDPARRSGALERLERVAREAAALSFRSRLPSIGPPLSISELADRDGVIVAHRSGPRLPEVSGPTWTLVVGPEGGLTAAEQAVLAGRPHLGLGDLVLRAETAAVAGCTILATLRDR